MYKKLPILFLVLFIGIIAAILFITPPGNGEPPEGFIEMGTSYEQIKAKLAGKYPDAHFRDEKYIASIEMSNYNGISGANASVIYWCNRTNKELEYIRLQFDIQNADKLYAQLTKDLTKRYGKPYLDMSVRNPKDPTSKMKGRHWKKGLMVISLTPMELGAGTDRLYLVFSTSSGDREDLENLKTAYEEYRNTLPFLNFLK